MHRPLSALLHGTPSRRETLVVHVAHSCRCSFFKRVWIDFDQNGTLDDAGEMVYESTVGVGPFSGTITIPGTATTGETRMRVRVWDTPILVITIKP